MKFLCFCVGVDWLVDFDWIFWRIKKTDANAPVGTTGSET